ncbi:MAG TPA: phosphotransferase [Acidimicrobiia bacterium]|nr:phosphotransferase [Acidimicrobiia bacterium]
MNAILAKVTPEALTAVLAGSDPQLGPVVDVVVEPLGIEGAFCDLARLRLTYGPSGTPGPASVVAKVPKEAPAVRAMGSAIGLYDRERRFYAELAADVPVRVPVCYHPGDGGIGEVPMLLEDLGGLRPGDQVAGLDLDEAGTVIDRLAALHAARWGSPMPGGEWLCSLDDPAFSAGIVGLVGSGVDTFEARFAGRLPAAARTAAASAARHFGPYLDRCRSGPLTLAHFDARADNWLFDASGEPVLIDWQTAASIRGVHDVAYVVAASLATDLQGDHWQSLLRRYHDRLGHGGVTDYPWTDCLAHYRRHVAYASLLSLALLGSAEIGSERGRALADAVILRGIGHAAEIGAYDLDDH